MLDIIRGNEAMEAADQLTRKIAALHAESSVDEGMKMKNDGIDAATLKEGNEEKISSQGQRVAILNDEKDENDKKSITLSSKSSESSFKEDDNMMM